MPEAIGGIAGAAGGPAGVAAGVAGGHIAKEALGSLLPTALEEGATALGINPTTPAGHKLVERGALSSAIGKASMAVRPGGAGMPSAEGPATTIPEGKTPQSADLLGGNTLGAAGNRETPRPVARSDVDAIDLEHHQAQGRHQANLIEANKFIQDTVKAHPEYRDPNTVNALLGRSQGDQEA